MKKVLIALDYGLSAQSIAEKGLELAKGLKAKVTLLHVVAEESYYSIVDTAPFIGIYGNDFFDLENNENLVESSLSFLERIKTNLNSPESEVVAKPGDFETVILETATNWNADVIVLGSHSKNWLQKAVVGSVTESILSKSKIPLFIIPIKENNE